MLDVGVWLIKWVTLPIAVIGFNIVLAVAFIDAIKSVLFKKDKGGRK